MLRNYLTIAIRNLRKYKFYSAINILGLSIGIAAFLFILLYVQDELSYDRYHENAEQIIRRGGAEFACRDAPAHARCCALHERLKGAALPAKLTVPMIVFFLPCFSWS